MRHAHEPPSLDPRPVPDRHLFLVPDSLYGLDLLNPSTVVKLPRALLRDLEADAAPIFEPRCPTDPQAALPLSIHLFANSSLECARCRRQAAELRFPKLVPLVLGALRQYFAIKASMKTEEEASAVTGMGVVLQHAVDGMDLDEEWVDRHFFETREAGDSSLRIGRGRLYLTGQEMGALRRAVTTAKSSRLPMWPEDAITESIWTKEEAQFVRRIPGRDSPFAPAGGFFAVLRARVCGYLAVLLRSLKRLLSGLLQLRAH